MGICASRNCRGSRGPSIPDPKLPPTPADSAGRGGQSPSLQRTARRPKGSARSASRSASKEPTDAVSAGQFILENKHKLRDVYNTDETKLGEGTFGCVVLGRHKVSGVPRAIKRISKAHVKDLAGLRQEIAMMKMMDHPNIIRLFETFEDSRHIFLVMELCEGGELFDRIVAAGRFNEMEAASVIQDLLRCIFYMHLQNVVHRDLKPENFLLHSKGPLAGNLLKLIDFGTARRADERTVLTTKIGTPFYVAPQVMKGRYDRSCDVWSCGAIMYVLLCGAPPFNGDSDAEIIQKVCAGRLTFHEPVWSRISPEAKLLVRQLMRMNSRERLTAEEALSSEWIKKMAPKGPVVSLAENFTERWHKYKSLNRLRKAALHIIAGQLNDAESKKLRENFIAMDADGNGQLTRDELRDGLREAGLVTSDADLQSLMEAVDTDGSGVIDFTEFIAASIDGSKAINREACWTAFNLFDRDGDGEVSGHEICQVLDQGVATQQTETLVATLDTDGDGTLSFEEFLKMMDVEIEADADVLASPAERRTEARGVSLDQLEVPDEIPDEDVDQSSQDGHADDTDQESGAAGAVRPEQVNLAPEPVDVPRPVSSSWW